jgi:hypothetical protein
MEPLFSNSVSHFYRYQHCSVRLRQSRISPAVSSNDQCCGSGFINPGPDPTFQVNTDPEPGPGKKV